MIVIPGNHIDAAAIQQTTQVNTSRADTLTAELLPFAAKITVTST